MTTVAQTDILAQLQQQILVMQGCITATIANAMSFDLGSLESCFPNGLFPTGNIH